MNWLAEPLEQLQTRTLPFQGRWLTSITPISKDQWDRGLASAYYNVGLDLTRAGRLQQAADQYLQALALNPEDANAHHNLGAVYARQGRLSQAIAQYREVLRLRPDSVQARSNLGVILAQQGDRQEAIAQFRAALRRRPDHPGVLNALATTLVTGPKVSRGDAEEAARLAKRACELTGYEQPLILDTLAMAYASAGRLEEAVVAARRALRLAQANGQSQLADGIRRRLKSYAQRPR